MDIISFSRRPGPRYSLAVVSTATALFLRFGLNPVLGISVPYITFFPAIMLSSWACGLGPGLMTTVLGAVAVRYFLLVPSHSFAPSGVADTLGQSLFLAVGA